MSALFTMAEASLILEREQTWLGSFLKRNPSDESGRLFFTKVAGARRFDADGLKRLEMAILAYDERPAFVYFAEMQGHGQIKIGMAVDWHKRLLNLQSASPFRIRRLLVLRMCVGAERLTHDKFAKFHVRGEWFTDCPEIRNFIARCHGHKLFVIGEDLETGETA
jgi:hypothetical protein